LGLVAKSLVVTGGEGAVARYRLHDTTRVYAREKLEVCRWRTGERPLPAAVPSQMRELASSTSQEMIRLACELQTDVRRGEDRAARGSAGRARASHNRAVRARVLRLRALQDERL
jgi:predicted ATPase